MFRHFIGPMDPERVQSNMEATRCTQKENEREICETFFGANVPETVALMHLEYAPAYDFGALGMCTCI